MSASVKLNTTEEIVFDLEKYQGKHNSFDKSKVHSTQSKIKVIDKIGRTHQTTLMSAEIMIRMLAVAGGASPGSPGSFIDHCFRYFTQKEIEDMLKGSY